MGKIHLTFLGTGTSQGVPVIACDCDVCRSNDPKDKRLRSSIYVEVDGLHLVVDTGPDFRQQMLLANVKQLDAVLFTHEHKDHVAGLDDIRAFNFRQRKKMEVYATERVQEALKREYSYIFADFKYPGIPQIELNTIDKSAFYIKETLIRPVEVMHYKLPVLGFRIGNLSYITDANYIAPEEKEKIRGSEVLVLNALRKESHISHFTLDEAIAMAKELEAKTTYFTHISHLMGKHADVSKELPEGMHIAYDGLKIEL